MLENNDATIVEETQKSYYRLVLRDLTRWSKDVVESDRFATYYKNNPYWVQILDIYGDDDCSMCKTFSSMVDAKEEYEKIKRSGGWQDFYAMEYR